MRFRNGMISLSSVVLASTLYAAGPSADPDADNTVKNEIHNGVNSQSADQQSNASTDVELTRKIRQAVVNDKSLSTYAHNVKIITNNGTVVLKGPVKDSKEKKFIENQAARIAGADKVRSEIEIATK